MTEEINNTMKGLLKDLSVSKENEAKSCTAIDAKIQDLQVKMDVLIAERKDIADPYHWQQEEIETDIKELATIMAKSFKSDLGEVKFRKGYNRVSYEAKTLDKICSSDEMVKKAIWPFRKVSPIEPSISITTLTPVKVEVEKPKIEMVEEV